MRRRAARHATGQSIVNVSSIAALASAAFPRPRTQPVGRTIGLTATRRAVDGPQGYPCERVSARILPRR